MCWREHNMQRSGVLLAVGRRPGVWKWNLAAIRRRETLCTIQPNEHLLALPHGQQLLKNSAVCTTTVVVCLASWVRAGAMVSGQHFSTWAGSRARDINHKLHGIRASSIGNMHCTSEWVLTGRANKTM